MYLGCDVSCSWQCQAGFGHWVEISEEGVRREEKLLRLQHIVGSVSLGNSWSWPGENLKKEKEKSWEKISI